MFNNNSIIITNSSNKENILKELSNTLLNIKIYTLQEFKKLYYFDYTEETIYYVMNKYNVIYDISKIYINNLYNLEDKEYKNKKLIFLSNIKKDLIENKLLKVNKLFKKTLINKNIIIYNLPKRKELTRLINELKENNNVEIQDETITKKNHLIYEFNTIEEEVNYIANKICSLIKEGIDINNIYLTNLDNEYYKLIRRLFPMYKIPYELNNKDSIYGTYISNKFIELLDNNIEETLTNLKEYIHNEKEEEIYNKIINILNKYTFIDNKLEIKELIINDLKNTNISSNELNNSVKEVNLEEYIFNDNDYVFIPSFNQGIIPKIYKDEEYLTDKDKQELNISLTVDNNNLSKEIIINKINTINNAIITYKLSSNGETFNISNINEELNYEIINNKEYIYNNSELYNKIKLTSLLDTYYKYGTTSSVLYNLNNNYKELEYNKYDNKFKGIDKQELKEYLNNKLTLSYSSLDKYFRCPFSYYIGNILKLNIYEETFYQIIGTLFHSILEKFNTSTLSYEELWQSELNNLNKEFNPKETFFLNKLKKELLFIIETIKNQENFTNLHDEYHEERIYTSISGEMEIKFTGIIDKIKYKKEDNDTIIAIIDYKTGNPNLDLTTIKYGIGMQLPIYLYLAKNSKKLTNVKVAGFYLQHILNNEVIVDNTHTYEQLKKQKLLLQGYSNDDQNILSEFDSSYQDSNLIKSMKTKQDGSYIHYAKTLTNKQMDIITNIAEENINLGAELITNANFEISPKKILKENYGCTLCKFKDICFYSNKDIKELKPQTIEDILGGE